MKFIKWLFINHTEIIIAVVSAILLFVGFIVSAAVCYKMDRDREREGYEISSKLEQESVEVVVLVEEQEKETYFDVPLSDELQKHIFSECEKNGIDPSIVISMCFVESSYDQNKIGDGGDSHGLMQVQPRWHKERMERLGCKDLFDPFQNVTVAVDFLSEKLQQYGDVEKAITAYNLGHYSGTITNYTMAVLDGAKKLVVEPFV